MTAAFLFAIPKTQFFDNNGLPLADGQLYSYQAGSTTPLATYTDETGATPNANPVVLDSTGRANIWMSGAAYKFVLEDSLGNVIWTVDNVSAVGYFGTNVTVPGTLTVDGAATFQNNVTIDDNLTVDGTTTLDGIVTLGSELDGAAEVSVTAATTLVLNNVGSNIVSVAQAGSGSVTISAITLANGSWRILKFNGVNTLENSSTLVLPGGANITTASGDKALVYGEASGVVQVIYFAAGGAPISRGGTIGGTATAITATAPNFSLTDQSGIVFDVGSTNTGATTLNANSTGAIAIQKATSAGLVALSGGEMQAGQSVICVYNGSVWVLQNPAQTSIVKAWGAFSGGTSGVAPTLVGGSGIASITYVSTGVYLIALNAGVVPDTNFGVLVSSAPIYGYSGDDPTASYIINSDISVTVRTYGTYDSGTGAPTPKDTTGFTIQILHV